MRVWKQHERSGRLEHRIWKGLRMRLAIIEDDGMLRENLRLLLNGESDIDVVGAFGSAEEALLEFHACSPELLLVDLGLPGISGVELIEKAREQMPSVEIMAYTIY